MATTTGLQTINLKDIQEVNADPSASAGTPATDVGSIALSNNSGVGQLWLKTGSADTAWDRLVSANDGTFINSGTFLRLALFDTSPGPASHLGDHALQNAFSIDVAVQAQATRSTAIEYRIPNPGDAITAADFILSEGAQTKNGNMTFNNNVTVQGSFTVNGTLTYINSTTTNVSDPFMTLNVGGASGSGSGVGFKIEEAGSPTGYFLTSAARTGFDFKAPASSFALTMKTDALSAARTISVPDASGTFVTRNVGNVGVANALTYWTDANAVAATTGMSWNDGTGTLTLPHVVASTDLTISSFTQGSVIFAGTSGLLSQDNAKFFWDDTNFRLGLGTATPSRTLHVNGTSLFTGAVRQADATATKANWEKFQAQVSTTDATVTTVATVATITDSNMFVKVTVCARRSGGTAGTADDAGIWTRTARIKNVAGVATLFTLQSDYTSEDQKSWTTTMTISGTNALISVKGAANNNVDWTANYEVITLS